MKARRAADRGCFFLGLAVVSVSPLGRVLSNGVLVVASLFGYEPIGYI